MLESWTLLKTSWVDYRDEQLFSSDEEIPELGFSVKDARGDTGKTAAAIQYLQAKYIYGTGLSRFSGARLNKAAQWMLQRMTNYLTQTAAATETTRNNSILNKTLWTFLAQVMLTLVLLTTLLTNLLLVTKVMLLKLSEIRRRCV